MTRDPLLDLVLNLVEDAGYELVDLRRTGEAARPVLSIRADRPDATPGHGISTEECARLSRALEAALEAATLVGSRYTLEVSSPGIERPLKRPAHFRRAVGEQVKVKTTAPVAGSRTHVGALLRADDEGIALDVAGTELRVPYADVASARTVVDWDAELKRSNA